MVVVRVGDFVGYCVNRQAPTVLHMRVDVVLNKGFIGAPVNERGVRLMAKKSAVLWSDITVMEVNGASVY